MVSKQHVSPYSGVPAHPGPHPTKQACKQPCRNDDVRVGWIRFVFRGDEYWVVAREASAPDAATELTPTEEHVLALLRAGMTYDQIAASRGRSRHTVAKQITSVLRKLKVASQRELELA